VIESGGRNGGKSSMHGTDIKYIWVRKSKGMIPPEKPGVDGKIILKQGFKK
jgi:hypothetical protein